MDLLNKISVAQDRLRQFEPEQGYHLAFSGGKDSVVIKELAEMSGVKFTSYYNNTTIDPPELIQFIKKHHSDVIWNNPEKHLLAKMVEKSSMHTRMGAWCCDIYKEIQDHDKFIIMGVRTEESPKRKDREMFKYCQNLKRAGRQLNPIIDWTEKDVWGFIKKRKLPYCSLYDEGFSRLGCVMCPKASRKNRIREMKRFPSYRRLFIKYFCKLHDKWMKQGKEKPMWDNGVETFYWWMYAGN